jgi:cold shock CspA family protein
MPTGTVKWFNYQTGFGLSSLRRGNDVFVHISAVEPGAFQSCRGQKVAFEISPTKCVVK